MARDAEGGALEIKAFGNTFMAHERDSEARDTRAYHPGPLSWCLGVPYVEVCCPIGTAPGIARYYSHYLGAIAGAHEGRATVQAGPCQRLVFVEDPSFEIDASLEYQDAP